MLDGIRAAAEPEACWRAAPSLACFPWRASWLFSSPGCQRAPLSWALLWQECVLVCVHNTGKMRGKLLTREGPASSRTTCDEVGDCLTEGK